MRGLRISIAASVLIPRVTGGSTYALRSAWSIVCCGRLSTLLA